MSATEQHGEMNQAFATLLSLAVRLDLPALHKHLKDDRAFMARMIDERARYERALENGRG